MVTHGNMGCLLFFLAKLYIYKRFVDLRFLGSELGCCHSQVWPFHSSERAEIVSFFYCFLSFFFLSISNCKLCCLFLEKWFLLSRKSLSDTTVCHWNESFIRLRYFHQSIKSCFFIYIKSLLSFFSSVYSRLSLYTSPH